MLDISGREAVSNDEIEAGARRVLFKHDRIYHHQIFRINYTAYDVRRVQDVINPDTSHCNIMVLNGAPSGDEGDDNEPYLYARVLSVCHANVTYMGPGAVDYQPHRMDFLWVRWYQQIDIDKTGWTCRKLDRVRFPSFTGPTPEGGFVGFLDPSLVLRACHIVPRFRSGRRYEDSKGASFCGLDSSDWNEYYINR